MELIAIGLLPFCLEKRRCSIENTCLKPECSGPHIPTRNVTLIARN